VLGKGAVKAKGNGVSPSEVHPLPGDVVRVDGFLDLVPTALSPGEFDYRIYLEQRGIIAQIKAEGSS